MDQRNNRLHGFESYRNPFTPGFGTANSNPYGTQSGLFYGATPIDYRGDLTPPSQSRIQSPTKALGTTAGYTFPVPTYTHAINANQYYDPNISGGLNTTVYFDGEYIAPYHHEADEMNLYAPTQEDQPFNTTDLEWLYRLQDVDGGSLYSRLAYLAPLSFLNPIDGLRRRRMFALDTFDTTTFSWAPDDVLGNSFANSTQGVNSVGDQFVNNTTFGYPNGTNPSFVSMSNAGFMHLSTGTTGLEGQTTSTSSSTVFGQLGGTQATNQLGMPTPQLAHRDRRINLNYPLPVSNSPIEPVRQKWIRDTYTLLKSVLPPKSVDTPEELAQLSQFVVNIIDFRDPDCTATRFVNTDITVVPAGPAAVACTPDWHATGLVVLRRHGRDRA